MAISPESPEREGAVESRRRVVCAAIRAADGDLLLGIRHYSEDMHKQMIARSDGEKFAHRNGDDQGFVDQHGRYLTRREAYQIALNAGQVHVFGFAPAAELYSEDLY